MFSFWARRKGGKKKKVEVIFTPLKIAEQLAASILSVNLYTCFLSPSRNKNLV